MIIPEMTGKIILTEIQSFLLVIFSLQKLILQLDDKKINVDEYFPTEIPMVLSTKSVSTTELSLTQKFKHSIMQRNRKQKIPQFN